MIVKDVHGVMIMIDEKKLIDEITNLYNEYANDQTRFEREETKAIYRFIGALTYRIENMPKENEWIPVEERLPKEKEYVLIQNPYGVMSVACLLGGKWYNFQGVELWVAVAWMPLPKEYEKE